LSTGGGKNGASDEEGHNRDEVATTTSLSERLAQRLSAHRTAALQIEVARHPHVALAALVHDMVQTVLQGCYHDQELPLGVSVKVQDRLESLTPEEPESSAAVALHTLQETVGDALPQDTAELFAALLAKPQDELVSLLATCVASTVDVVTPCAMLPQPGAALAQAVGLDMAAWWQPTAKGYFLHVPKATTLEAVGQYAPETEAVAATDSVADSYIEADMPRIALTEVDTDEIAG
jgi:ParB family chromosome partitioning protein